MELNLPRKDYNAQMHTCEHILNQTMDRMFGCGRAINAHIETKKSKCDYALPQAPTEDEIHLLQSNVNQIIQKSLIVSEKLVSKEEAALLCPLDRLPNDASETIRLIMVGDYDICPCIGKHVINTSEIGTFVITSHDYAEGKWRVRFVLKS